jgi:Na+/H+ antiporter NhaD/arsenite permease-like protein
VANLASRGSGRSTWEFVRYGAPVTLVTMLLDGAYVWLRYLM